MTGFLSFSKSVGYLFGEFFGSTHRSGCIGREIAIDAKSQVQPELFFTGSVYRNNFCLCAVTGCRVGLKAFTAFLQGLFHPGRSKRFQPKGQVVFLPCKCLFQETPFKLDLGLRRIVVSAAFIALDGIQVFWIAQEFI